MMLGAGAPSSFVTCIAWSLLGATALLSLRAAFYTLFYERSRSYLRRRGPGYECYLVVVCEEVWEGLGSSLLLALTGWALYAGHNSHCHLTDTSGCIQGWPHHHHSPALDALFLMLLAWYLQSTVKHWFGLGRVQGSDVALHHAVTLALLALSYSLGLLRIGLLSHWVFQLTVPLHSVSKLLHCLDIRPVKKPVFYCYAAAFLATRVCLVPAVVLRCTLQDAFSVTLDWRLAGAANACLLLLYGISLFWFGRLIGILATGKLDATPSMVLTAELRKWQKRQ